MARRPFASLLAVSGVGLALGLALLVVAFPRPLQDALAHCTQTGRVCLQLLMIGQVGGSPLLLLAILTLLGWSIRRGWHAGRDQWRATCAGLARLRAAGLAAPATDLRALCADLGLADGIEVVTCGAPVALCHGLWRPRILCSTGLLALLEPAELKAVLCHERAHLRRRDPLRLLVARSLAAGLPFLPVLGELAAALPVAQELAADQAVLREQGRDGLGWALLAITAAQGAALDRLPLVAGIGGALDARLDQISGMPVVSARLSVGALVRTLLVLGCGLLALVLSRVVVWPAAAAAPAGDTMALLGRCLGIVGAWAGLCWFLLLATAWRSDQR